MSTEKVNNSWFITVGNILIQIVFGFVCAWSAFTNVLSDPDGAYQSHAPQTAWIFSAALFLFAQVMILIAVCSHFLW